mmetsp:Transcript_58688/g.104361  ORF Transcript_58688/g.104361 Transcript_58688/m.104361 type:complete len:927 (+) Transcript_58688:193-2973(+)|eukprot:CAMPEP_0197630512 /NCGR_PEP_ID=MMETSP1338-20131121/7965_1 /TAXON_ID=43686 ORGANISM="Pelagodinium beii, Strain RCC1491" /NCGR_SAMPLE_ID=MMETSP1338 /ASSEMBLY_ACC=CAM_ASM_000754 /LENGTH=926 /DNA_ID=CAMNT_0043201743 /DNA_START=192 /DNA_END=2972 /DNA_ORIENTATION=-
MAENGKKEEPQVETRQVTKDEAAFILGQGGKTKAKLCAVSGAQIDLAEGRNRDQSHLQVRGTAQQRKAALKYIEFVVAQRLGPVMIDNPSSHDDLTILTVPADTVSFITGKQGSFLRLVEEEWSALLFFLQVNPKNPPKDVDPNAKERLAIFGPERRRRGAQLKVMAAIEMKLPGYFTKTVGNSESAVEGFGTDTMIIKEEDYSYALGRSGATRKKLARASSCIVEYVGRVAYFSGFKKERVCAREYLTWLLQQRVGEHAHVDHKGRDDVTLIMVPANCIGYITGHKGSALRALEEETSTFCFIEGTANDGEDQKPLLIFGCLDDRCLAETLVWEKMSTKFDENGADYGGKRGNKGYGKYGKGKDRSAPATRAKEEPVKTWAPREPKEGESTETITITDDDAAFLMGPGGKTKRKIAAVSGADLELKTHRLDIIGTPEERARAMKYVKLVMAQRVGPVRLEDTVEHQDLTIIEVPADAVSFVTGKQGSFLRLVEEEFGTLLFFLDFNRSSRRDQLERLAIFGPLRERRGAELKVMAAIEMKQAGYFTKADSKLPQQDPTEGFATDRLVIEEDDYSYALGKGGATRKKIAKASECVIEYIGRLAYLSGEKKERTRAREYLFWLFKQRVGPVEVDYSNREDVTVLQVPKDCVGFVTGHKGTSLRAVEETTGTFCFIEGGRDDPQRDPKPLLIFGSAKSRVQAEEMLRKRIDQKLVEGWVHEEGGSGYGGGYNSGYSYKDRYGQDDGKGKGKKGVRKGKDKDGKGNGKDKAEAAARPPQADASDPTPAGSVSEAKNGAPLVEPSAPPVEPSAPAVEPKKKDDEGDDDEDGAWGDWGAGSSDDEPAKPVETKSNPFLGAHGKWGGSPYSGTMAAAMASPQRTAGGSGVVGMGYSPARSGADDVELPPHLMQEEAWPELGDMGAKKKGQKR